MNIFVTSSCGGQCRYCLAKVFMRVKKTLTKWNAYRFLWFLIKNAIKRKSILPELNVMGGEPFLYDKLGWFLRLLNRFKVVRYYTVFTGGIFPTENLEMLNGIKNCHVCLNLNEKKDYKPDVYELIIKNLTTLIDEKHIRVGLSFNIYSLNFNGDEIIETAEKFGITHIRFAIASPIYNHIGLTELVHPKDYPKLEPKVFDFIKKCDEKGITVNLDCRLPRCFFTEEHIGWFVQNNHDIAKGLQPCLCGGPTCISPDLMVSKCTVFSDVSEHLSKFSTIDEIIDWEYHSLDSRFGIPNLYPKCANCKHNTYCSGGCPAWKENWINNPDEVNKDKDLIIVMKCNIQIFESLGQDALNYSVFKVIEKEMLKRFSRLPRKPDPIMLQVLAYYYESTGREELAQKYKRQANNAGDVSYFS